MGMRWGFSAVVVSVLVTCISLGIIHIRSQERESELKRKKFTGIKLQVTDEVLQEYQHEIGKVADQLEQSRDELTRLGSEVKHLEEERESHRGPMDTCNSDKKQIHDEAAAIETQFDIITSDFQEQKGTWDAEKLSLTEKKQEQSIACEFIDKDNQEARILCGLGNLPKQDKPEQPEEQGPKQVPQKAEEANKEAPQNAVPKLEEPPKEAPQKDAPKQ